MWDVGCRCHGMWMCKDIGDVGCGMKVLWHLGCGMMTLWAADGLGCGMRDADVLGCGMRDVDGMACGCAKWGVGCKYIGDGLRK